VTKRYDYLIKNGSVISGSGIRRADVGILGEQIVSVEPGLRPEQAVRTVNASGKYVMPGVIDVHTHPVYEDDLGGVSLSAAYGGTTTLIHFAYARPGTKLLATIEKFRDEGLAKSFLDFGIHGALFDPAAQIEEIPKAFELGVSSFKMFMTYAKLKWMTDDYQLTAAMDVIAQCGGLAMVHAESGLVTDYLEDRSLRRGEDQKEVFLKTRPDYLEAEAVFRAASIAAVMDCPLYIVHLSTARAEEVLRRVRAEGQVVYVETCPQYLTMTDEVLQRLGPLAKIGPPLRTEKDRMALWSGIETGTVDVVASDHAPKNKKTDDPFFEAPFGSPQSETMLTVTYDEGVNTGRISVCRLVQLLSENPARIFGLFPKKGILRKGSDADLVIFDPGEVTSLAAESQHSGAKYTLYQGRPCLGRPVLTMRRGTVVIEQGEVKAKAGEAQFLKTKISGANPGSREKIGDVPCT
jgi:dihydropyrimidinase